MGEVVSLTTQFVSNGFAGISMVLAGMSGETAPMGWSGEPLAIGISAGTAPAGDFDKTTPLGSLTEICTSDGTVSAGIPVETDPAGTRGAALPVDRPDETALGISERTAPGVVAGKTVPTVGISSAGDPADIPDGTCCKHSSCAARAF
jgi:hypothetical protein